MKKLLLLPLLALCSCMPKYHETVYVSDFRKYTKDGFRIYPAGANMSGQPYTAVANIDIVFNAGTLPKDFKVGGFVKDEVTGINVPEGEYMADRLVEEAKKRGANAIINFKITRSYDKNTPNQFTASGVAVDIK